MMKCGHGTHSPKSEIDPVLLPSPHLSFVTTSILAASMSSFLFLARNISGWATFPLSAWGGVTLINTYS
jgi:hypothetical protein